MKPVIGILMRELNDKYYVKKELIDVLKKKNTIPISIHDIDSLNLCNGVIIPGGDEIINNDLEIIKYLYQNDIPTLGICLGMQEMGYLFNGKMNKTSNYDHLKPGKRYVHSVNINKNSKLYKILKKEKILVNSRHKDYIISTDLSISSISNVIESIEDKNKRFFIGVQWHPESMIDYDLNSNILFDEFIKEISSKLLIDNIHHNNN